MATTLVYHKPGAVGQTSPFDEAITQLAQGQSMDLACPFLSVEYLRRVVSLAEAWRLLTDVDAWVSSQTQAQRGEILRFLAEFPGQVRHDPRLHAKVIISQAGALVGSANFTRSGIESNVEMSVCITEAPLVQQLRGWFEGCWERAVAVPLDSVKTKIAACPAPPPTTNLVPASPGAFPAIAATLVSLESEEEEESTEEAAPQATPATVAASGSSEPPPVREEEFVAVSTADRDLIKQRFNAFMRLLHAYLNQLPCMRDLQQARRKWKSRTGESVAFGNFATDPSHWYTFNHGGRNEAQFNIGLWTEYLRVGLGFEFTLKEHGDPTAVGLAYSCFRKVIEQSRSQFEAFVNDNQLEIEWAAYQTEIEGGGVEIIFTDGVVNFLLNLPKNPGWIFIGRLLRRHEDAAVLGNPQELGKVMQAVLCGFSPYWERTQVMARQYS